jgi:hypothetical protein
MASSTVDSGRAWLADHLRDHQEHVAGGVLTEGVRAGYTEQTLRRAANVLKVQRQTAKYGRVNIELWRLLPDALAAFQRRQERDTARHARAVAEAQRSSK